MFRYEKIPCSACGEQLTEQDDIVVCPDCGAPHHRACWREQGDCFYADKHGTDEQWERKDREEKEENRTARCPRCGAINAKTDERCNACGGLMAAEEAWPETQIQTPTIFPMDFSGTAAGGEIPKDGNFEDVPAEAVKKFVSPNAVYYLRKFWQIDKFKRLGSFNFAALFFPGLWMIYRKMYLVGAIVAGVVGVLRLVSTYVSTQWSVPLIEGIYKRANVDLNAYDMESMMRLSAEIVKTSTGDLLLMFLPMLISFVMLGISIYICVMGNKIYYRHCLKQIRAVRTEYTELEQYEKEMARRGGVNVAIVLSIGLCFYALSRLFELYLANGA